VTSFRIACYNYTCTLLRMATLDFTPIKARIINVIKRTHSLVFLF
jgi:hypothetical protein